MMARKFWKNNFLNMAKTILTRRENLVQKGKNENHQAGGERFLLETSVRTVGRGGRQTI